MGVCIDTAHALAAGYEMRNTEDYERTFTAFEQTVGFKYLKGMHINDSKKEVGTRVDRHDSLGKGVMNMDLFEWMMNDARFDNMPLILETPEPEIWPQEIELLYGLIK